MVKTEKKRVRFVDTTLRDAHQSLWATRMRTTDILGILEAVDDAGFVQSTPDRTALRAVQTPQVFERALYARALARAAQMGKSYTDDCQLVEAAGGTVFLTPGDYRNIKITTPEDLLVAEAFAAAQDNAPG